jgi:2-keto-4-pentenoate hydratase
MTSVASVLAEGRRSGHKLKSYPGPAPGGKPLALKLQQEVYSILNWTPVGWKVACTSDQAQKALDTDGPFPGRLFAERLFTTGQHVPTEADNFRVTEPEIVFRMGSALTPREKPYSTDEVLRAVESVHAGLEIVNPRLPKGFQDAVEWYIADGALNDAMVVGPASKPLAREAYRNITTRASRNGTEIGSGTGANALGGPEIVLTWLVNDLSERGIVLAEGAFVTTGVITEMFSANRGDEITAVFSSLGRVSATF